MGDAVKAAEEPDWDSVATSAQALLQRTKDLRVAMHLATAWLRTDGLPGFAAGTELLRRLLETYWDAVHPQLDAEDDDDPTARVNAIAPLANHAGVMGYFQSTPFVASPRLGRFSLRDLRSANSEAKAPAAGGEDGEGGKPAASLAEIEACCMDCDEAALTDTANAIDRTLEHVRAIDQTFTGHVGTAGPDLKPLLTDVQEIKTFLDAERARRNPAAAGSADAAGETAGEAGSGTSAGAVNGRINGPQDVVRRIDEICDYYARAEPSSPVPLLLRRAQRLVGLTFADLLKDLAPSGVSELEVIAGPDKEASADE